jgi:hypothetical protein
MNMLDMYRRRYNRLREENEKMRKDIARRDTAMFLMMVASIVALTLMGVLK